MPTRPSLLPRRSTPWVVLAGALLLLPSPACKKPKADGPKTELVIGVQSEPMGGIVSALHIVVSVGGVVTSDEVVKPKGTSLVGFPQPWEKRLEAPEDVDAPVEVTVDATGQPNGPHLSRRAVAHFQPGKTSLLRVGLESRCVEYPPPPKGRGKIPGPLSGPSCTAPATCIRGLCQSPVVPPNKLEPYSTDWPSNAPDLCKPRGAGPPFLQIGTGQTGYTPLKTDQELRAEAGPQGGHHIWIAVRMKNMKQAGSTTKIEAVQPGTNTPIPPSTFAFTFEKDEGGYCKLYGLRYQLDNGGIDYTQFLGKPLDVTTTVVDALGATSSSTAHIRVAPTILNP
jgi:hypothetical protein